MAEGASNRSICESQAHWSTAADNYGPLRRGLWHLAGSVQVAQSLGCKTIKSHAKPLQKAVLFIWGNSGSCIGTTTTEEAVIYLSIFLFQYWSIIQVWSNLLLFTACKCRVFLGITLNSFHQKYWWGTCPLGKCFICLFTSFVIWLFCWNSRHITEL